jgi:ABC-2 type transport system ATP-binding protein
MITLENITIRYPSVVAINNISYEFKEGKIYGLVGPNGAGKTSLIRALVGLITQFDGNIRMGDVKDHLSRQKIKSLIGFAPEETNLFPYLTAREYLEFISDVRQVSDGSQKTEQFINLLGLEEVADDIVDRYSHGMRKKLSLAGALIAEPNYLILDEALNGLDPIAMHHIRKYLRKKAEEGITILLTSHVLEVAENWCDVIVILNKGEIAGTYSQDEIKSWCKNNNKNFSDFFVELIN